MHPTTIGITGASGFIGSRVCDHLLQAGHTLHLLQRNPADVQHLIDRGAIVFKGDLLKPSTLDAAFSGCTHVLHMAAYAKAWAKDNSLFYKVNTQGGVNVLQSALDNQVQRVLITSTAGVLGASGEGLADEQSKADPEAMTHYEKSKARLEAQVPDFIQKGLDVVIVNPARVFGPGEIDDSNGEVKVMLAYLQGNFRFLPGDGSATASYVYVEDVATGHILALEKGKSGERYVLGGDNASYATFFNTIGQLSRKKYRLWKMPFPFIMTFARMQMWKAKLIGRKPIITPELVRKYKQNWSFDSSKAIEALGYSYRTLEQSVDDTLEWIQKNKLLE